MKKFLLAPMLLSIAVSASATSSMFTEADAASCAEWSYKRNKAGDRIDEMATHLTALEKSTESIKFQISNDDKLIDMLDGAYDNCRRDCEYERGRLNDAIYDYNRNIRKLKAMQIKYNGIIDTRNGLITSYDSREDKFFNMCVAGHGMTNKVFYSPSVCGGKYTNSVYCKRF